MTCADAAYCAWNPRYVRSLIGAKSMLYNPVLNFTRKKNIVLEKWAL
jgi:hypothetical protein